MLEKIINNYFVPLRLVNMKMGHIAIYSVIIFAILLQILMLPVEGDTRDLYNSSKAYYIKRKINDDKISERERIKRFNLRDNNLLTYVHYYEKHSEHLKKYFGVRNTRLPKPKYPFFSHLLKPFSGGLHIFPPSNTVEIATFLRKDLGSGITIRKKDELIDERGIKGKNRGEIVKLIHQYKLHLSQYFTVEVMGSLGKHLKSKSYKLNYKDFPDFKTVLSKDFRGYDINEVRLMLSPESQKFISHGKIRKTVGKGELESKLLTATDKRRLSIDTYRFYGDRRKKIVKKIGKLRDKTARVFTLILYGKKNGVAFQRKSLIRFGNFPTLKEILPGDLDSETVYGKIKLYESKILKYKANSREIVDSSQIPAIIRKAFILVEDDYYYFQAGGIDPVGLIKASFNYILKHEKKGNASIMEQIYEMYIGQQRKSPFDKFLQILGTIYLSAYAEDRDSFVNLYVQSITASWWRDHNYGVKGIIKNYLNKDSLEDIKLTDTRSIKELAWLTRLAFSPNEIGPDYIRFHDIRNELRANKIDIYNEKQLKRYLLRHPMKSIRLSRERHVTVYDVITRLRRSYEFTNQRMKTSLRQFMMGNEFIRPIITKAQYQKAMKEFDSQEILFNPSQPINEYQSYTDQTKKDLIKFVGEWGLNLGLDVEVDFDEEAQKVLDEELRRSTRLVFKYIPSNQRETSTNTRYGGAAILVKTHRIDTGEIVNKIVAIASKHTESKKFYNWAVEGSRHFGSIFKWFALLLYLDDRGTLLDTYYDIPRTFKYKAKTSKGVMKEFEYHPDNWKRSQDDDYGYYTFDRRNNVYNFIQSKNNTFVRISEKVGLKKFSDSLNEAAGFKKKVKWLTFIPNYTNVLGSHAISSIRFAQINTVIANKGISRPLSTITRLVEPNGSSLYLDLGKRGTQTEISSREAAEAAFFCGHVNTFYGTAKRFVKGGIGKTGSSPTDVSFLAMTGRTEKEYNKNPKTSRDRLFNHNLLYLVNIGVNEGFIHDGLYGGTVAATNANAVFTRLLQKHRVGNQIKWKYKISGDFTKYFSKKFVFKKIPGYGKLKAPIYRGRRINNEAEITLAEIDKIRDAYEIRKDDKSAEKIAEEYAKLDGKDFGKLSRKKKEAYRDAARREHENRRLDEYYSRSYEQDLTGESEKAERRSLERSNRRSQREPDELNDLDKLDESEFRKSYKNGDRKGLKKKNKPKMSRYARDELARDKYENRADKEYYNSLYKRREETQQESKRRKRQSRYARENSDQGPLNESEDAFMKKLVGEQVNRNRRNRRNRRRERD